MLSLLARVLDMKVRTNVYIYDDSVFLLLLGLLFREEDSSVGIYIENFVNVLFQGHYLLVLNCGCS